MGGRGQRLQPACGALNYHQRSHGSMGVAGKGVGGGGAHLKHTKSFINKYASKMQIKDRHSCKDGQQILKVIEAHPAGPTSPTLIHLIIQSYLILNDPLGILPTNNLKI